MRSLLKTFPVLMIGASIYMACSDDNGPDIPTESPAVLAGSEEANAIVEAGANSPEEGKVADDTANKPDGSKENPDETSEDVPSPGPSPTPDTANLPPDTSTGGGNPAPAPEPAPAPAPNPNPVPAPAPAPEGAPEPAPVPAPAPAPQFAANCAEIKKAQAGAQTGLSQIFLNANDPVNRRGIEAFCDQDEDGGGWTLMMNYVHKANTNPALIVKQNTLPLLGSSTLGTDESGQAKFWGHAGNAMLRNFEIKELRFFCKSSKLNNVLVNFKTSDPACIQYAKTGQGSCAGVKNAFAKLTGHNGSIPALQDAAAADKGDQALTNDTLVRILQGNPDPPDPSWSVRGGGNQQNWECDFGSNDAANDTIHRIYFR